MEDTFVECLVKTRTSMLGNLARVGGILLILLSFGTVIFLAGYCLIVVFFAAYLEYLIWHWTSVEYEYAFISGELDVDRILGQRSRKRFFTVSFDTIEIAAYEEDERIRGYMNPDVTVMDFSSGTGERCMALCGTADGHRVRIMIEPDQEMAEAMAKYAPKKVFLS